MHVQIIYQKGDRGNCLFLHAGLSGPRQGQDLALYRTGSRMEKGSGEKAGRRFPFDHVGDRVGTVLAYLKERRVVLLARGSKASQEVDGFIP